jgi:hypothetical protein
MQRADIEIYPDKTNPALIAIHKSNQMRAICLAEAQRARGLYIRTVAYGDDPRYEGQRLHQSTSASTLRGFSENGINTWLGEMAVTSGHVLPHEFGWEDTGRTPEFHEGAHDLNYVLETLGP